MIYIFLFFLAVISIVFSIIARKEINKTKTEEEKRIVKAKWQLICGVLGGACILVAGVFIFLMF